MDDQPKPFLYYSSKCLRQRTRKKNDLNFYFKENRFLETRQIGSKIKKRELTF